MPANNLVCKFDPSHGLFITPVKLSQHYREFHGDVWEPKPPNVRRYRCQLCGGEYRNPTSHVQQKHPADAAPPVVGRVMLRIDDGPEVGGRRTEQRQSRQAVDVVKHESDTAPRHVGPWTVDDIVLPVVEQLAKPSGKVPVSALAALFVWRDATAAMLRDVTRRD